MHQRFFNTCMAGAATCLALIAALAAKRMRITIVPRQVAWIGALVLALVGIACFYRWRREEKLTNLVVVTIWAVIFTNLALIPMYALARRQVNLADTTLARMDAQLGFEVPVALQLVRRWPLLRRSQEIAYVALLPLMGLAIIVPPLAGAMRRAKEFVVGTVVAGIISFSLFGIVQAIGPWSIYPYEPHAAQAEVQRVFLSLKQPGDYHFDLNHVEGLISFPSFHTILAVLSAYALWPVRKLRWPAALIAGAVVVSTVTTGWHYVVDTYVGLAISVATVGTAKAYSWVEQRLKDMGRE